MARIAIGWELGSSPDLLYDVRDIGRALSRQGHSITYIVADPVALSMLFGSNEQPDVLAAPIPSVRPELLAKSAREGGFIDKLAAQGFATAESLTLLAKTWQRIIAREKIDLVLAVGAPVLALAVRGKHPLFVVGSAESMPPTDMKRLPRIVANIAPALTDDKLLANATAAIQAIGGRPVERPTDLIAGDATLVYGLPLLDPYASLRGGRTAPLRLLPGLMTPTATPGLVAVLDINHPTIETTAIALTDLGKVAIHVYIRGGTRPMQAYLSQTTNIVVHQRAEDALSHLGNASYIIHHGLPLAAEAALSAGRPQIIMPFIHEQGVVAGNLERNGYALAIYDYIAAPALADYFVRQFRNLQILQQAQLMARELAAVEFPDTLAAITKVSEGLIGARRG